MRLLPLLIIGLLILTSCSTTKTYILQTSGGSLSVGGTSNTTFYDEASCDTNCTNLTFYDGGAT